MEQIYFERWYLAYNFIVGSVYLLWIYLMQYNGCKCSKSLLDKLIHIYWYVIFILDILIFFNIYSIDSYYLIVLGNILGLGNIYMTYKYIQQLDENKCGCSDNMLKTLIILIYMITVIMIIFYFIFIIIMYISNRYFK
jgi:hypothetical protein